MTPPPLLELQTGQKIVCVCYGSDPTYADVSRPTFDLWTGVVTAVSGECFKTGYTRGWQVKEHCHDRLFLAQDEAGITACIKRLASNSAIALWHQSRTEVWRIPPEPATLELYAKTASQYETGDYDMVYQGEFTEATAATTVRA